MILLNYWKQLLALILIVAAGGTGYYYGKGDVIVQKEVTTVKGDTQVVVHDHIITVTRTVRPDGTTMETTRTEEKAKTEESHTSTRDTSSTVTPIAALPNYSLGVNYGIRYSGLLDDVVRPDPQQVQVQFGRRFLGPVWGEVGAGLKQVTLGVRVEF